MCRLFPVITVKPGQTYPPRFHQWIYYSKVESIGSWRFHWDSSLHCCMRKEQWIHMPGIYEISTRWVLKGSQRQTCTDSHWCGFCGCVALWKPSSYIFVLTSMPSRDLPLLYNMIGSRLLKIVFSRGWFSSRFQRWVKCSNERYLFSLSTLDLTHCKTATC